MRNKVIYPTHSLDTENGISPPHPELTIYIASSWHDRSRVFINTFIILGRLFPMQWVFVAKAFSKTHQLFQGKYQQMTGALRVFETFLLPPPPS